MSEKAEIGYEEAFWVLAGMFINDAYLLNEYQPVVASASAQALAALVEELGEDVDTLARRAITAFEKRALSEAPRTAEERAEVQAHIMELEMLATLEEGARGPVC